MVSHTWQGVYVSLLLGSLLTIKDLLRPPPDPNEYACPKASTDQGEESPENRSEIKTKLLVLHRQTPAMGGI